MKILCMDSAHKHLVLALIEDTSIVAASAQECWKKQSENLFPRLMELMEQAKWEVDMLDRVVITDGPGSYTGVRIAMTVAKVLCTRKHIPLYCLSSLQLYGGICPHAYVMLDARSNRAYAAELRYGKLVDGEHIQALEELKRKAEKSDAKWFGDTQLIGKDSEVLTLAENFRDLLPLARPIENIHTLTPRYLKDADAYRRK